MNRKIMNMGRNMSVTAKGTIVGNGLCSVRVEWLPEPLDVVASKFGLIADGKVLISDAFVDNPWHADAVYAPNGTEYTADEL